MERKRVTEKEKSNHIQPSIGGCFFAAYAIAVSEAASG